MHMIKTVFLFGKFPMHSKEKKTDNYSNVSMSG